MNSNQNKKLWWAASACLPAILMASQYGFLKLKSIYKTDQGNGVVIHADEYVNSGKWVFHCGTLRIISREPLPAPIRQIGQIEKMTLGTMYYPSKAEEEQARSAIRAITSIDGWYHKVLYRYSSLDEEGRIMAHNYDLIARHNGQLWALNVSQWLGNNNSFRFKIRVEPYDPDTYMDHARMLRAAAKSCPISQ